ncbi:retrovirus-related pol polyprotein from transposon TNT 1-94 [Tanacetum coccineum]
MTSFDYRLNPLYAIRECSSCGALYNKSCGCSKGGLIDKFVRDPNKMPDSSQRPPIVCVKCGNPVEGPSCQGCALWRKKLKEVELPTQDLERDARERERSVELERRLDEKVQLESLKTVQLESLKKLQFQFFECVIYSLFDSNKNIYVEKLLFLIDFLKLVQRGLHAQVRTVRTDKGTEFLNKTLHAYFAQEGIEHQTSTARTPEQNGVVERRNRTLVEAARKMLSVAKVPLFFWDKAIVTECFTQNRSLVIPRHEKTPYHIINGRKPSVKFFHIFGSLCYIVRDGENLDKMKEKGDACIFVGYSTQSRAYRVYNKRTKVIVETIHVNVDKLPQMASYHVSLSPGPQS